MIPATVYQASQATVYSAGGRRYFTKAAALRAYVRSKFRAKHPCECEAPDMSIGYAGYDCGLHGEAFERVSARYIRFIKHCSKKPTGGSK